MGGEWYGPDWNVCENGGNAMLPDGAEAGSGGGGKNAPCDVVGYRR